MTLTAGALRQHRYIVSLSRRSEVRLKLLLEAVLCTRPFWLKVFSGPT